MKLVSGRDYPNTYREFVKMFPDDATCAAFLALLRWPEGFVCPACKITTTPWNESRGRLACPICRHQTSVSTGTIFDKTRTPLMTWFEAAWHVSSAKNGMSAKTLERTIGTSYQVAWMMLQRFRVAMVNIDRNQLSGDVEVDETFVGGEEHGGKRGRGTNKSIVVIAVEIRQPKGFGRVRMRHIPDASGESLLPFVHEVVAPGSVVRTDGWSGYNGLTDYGYTRDILVQSSSGDPCPCLYARGSSSCKPAETMASWHTPRISIIPPPTILLGGIYVPL
jgi:transposase-like protein